MFLFKSEGHLNMSYITHTYVHAEPQGINIKEFISSMKSRAAARS